MRKALIILLSLLVFITMVSFNTIEYNTIEYYTIEYNNEKVYYENPMIWISDWTSSGGQSGYGVGKFFYRISRSQYPENGYYLYNVSFISDSYYHQTWYTDENNDGVLDVYRCATKIDNMQFFINGVLSVNTITHSNTFWILFKGDYNRSIGEVRIAFIHASPTINFYMLWSTPKPF